MRSRAYMRLYWFIIGLVVILASVGGLVATQIMK